MQNYDEAILTAEHENVLSDHFSNVKDDVETTTHNLDAAYRWMYGIPKRMKEYVPSQEEVDEMIDRLLNLQPNVVTIEP